MPALEVIGDRGDGGAVELAGRLRGIAADPLEFDLRVGDPLVDRGDRGLNVGHKPLTCGTSRQRGQFFPRAGNEHIYGRELFAFVRASLLRAKIIVFQFGDLRRCASARTAGHFSASKVDFKASSFFESRLERAPSDRRPKLRLIRSDLLDRLIGRGRDRRADGVRAKRLNCVTLLSLCELGQVSLIARASLRDDLRRSRFGLLLARVLLEFRLLFGRLQFLCRLRGCGRFPGRPVRGLPLGYSSRGIGLVRSFLCRRGLIGKPFRLSLLVRLLLSDASLFRRCGVRLSLFFRNEVLGGLLLSRQLRLLLCQRLGRRVLISLLLGEASLFPPLSLPRSAARALPF